MASLKSLAHFYQRLAIFIESGIPMGTALVEISSSELGSLGKALKTVSSNVGLGEPLASAMALHPEVFPKLHVQLIDAGEQSGSLPSVLKSLADAAESSIATRRVLIGGLIYPIIVLHVLIFVPPVRYLIMNGLSAYLAAVLPWLVVLYGGVGGGYLAYRFLKHSPLRNSFDRLLLAIPGLGGTLLRRDVGDAATALSALYGAGIPVTKAMEATTEVPRNAVIANCFRAAHRRLQGGATLSESFAPEHRLPLIFRDMVSSGEASGHLAENLEKARDVLIAEANFRSKTGAAILPVVIYLVVAAAVAWTVISMYMERINQINDILNQ